MNVTEYPEIGFPAEEELLFTAQICRIVWTGVKAQRDSTGVHMFFEHINHPILCGRLLPKISAQLDW